MRFTSAAELVFVDASVILYSIDAAAGSKQIEAQTWLAALWAHAVGRLNWQVLNAFYAVATRKMKTPATEARLTVRAYAEWVSAGFSLNLVERAWQWTHAAQLSYCDALIVAAAEASDCRWLLTEDLQDERAYGSVRIINPFRASPADFGLFVPE